MTNIKTIEAFAAYVINDGMLPVTLEITGPNSFSLAGKAYSKESLYGAISKLVTARKNNEIPCFTGELPLMELLSKWEGGGGGFSGGGASGNW